MDSYIVTSGQNIYDVALTLYGSVEGIFDLLISNTTSIDGRPLTMTTKLEAGTVLFYHKEFELNGDIVNWLRDNNVDVKNGEGDFYYVNPLDAIIKHIYSYHPERYDNLLNNYTAEEQREYWKNASRPRMVIKQMGTFTNIKTYMLANTHMIIDWGDETSFRVCEGGEELEIEHQYSDEGEHTVTLYGNFECYILDLREINGVHYCIDDIRADYFYDSLQNQTLNKLIETIQ